LAALQRRARTDLPDLETDNAERLFVKLPDSPPGTVANGNGRVPAHARKAASVRENAKNLLEGLNGDLADCPRSPNVGWQRSRTTRRKRWESLGQGGATLWFTGLPGAGKSTIAGAVEERLIAAGQSAFLLDGDNLRHGLNGDLGFDERGRSENVRRTAHVARLFAESGTIALVGLVSPYAADREEAAALHAAVELDFIEVFVDAPLELCEQRDPKGLYARARAGELLDFTGVGAPYEEPTQPDLVLGGCEETVQREADRVLELLAARGSISNGWAKQGARRR
jgi:adenylyl-sulfate kinase